MAIVRWVVRLSGLLALVLGVLYWTGLVTNLLAVHMLLGLILVIGLWIMAFLGARKGAPIWLVALALVWGLVVPAFGMTQARILPGSAHWVIQVLHLVVGMIAMGLSEQLVGRSVGGRLATS